MTKQILDYSASLLSGAAIKKAGFAGSIRYLKKKSGKSSVAVATTSEVKDHLANGLQLSFVYEDLDIYRPLLGYNAGVTDGNWALQQARALGVEPRCIYFAVDFVATQAQQAAIMNYLTGAIDAIGNSRVGVYGFQLTIKTAQAQGKGKWYWQCGSRSSVLPGVHLYQHNNDNTIVSGMTCDVNDILIDDYGQLGGEVDMTPQECLDQLHQVVYNERTVSLVDGEQRNIVDYLRQIEAVVSGQTQTIAGLQAAVNVLANAVASNKDITVDEIEQAVTKAIKDNVVTVEINAKSV